MRVCQQCGVPAEVEDRFCASCGAKLPHEDSSSASDPLVGRVIGGSYKILEIVGVGGMGRVYRAEQGTLGRTVAIKVIHPHLLGDEQTVARFYQEARAASRLNHPNSVSIIDFGRTEDGILYLAMEHLDGKDLAQVMHEDGPLPFRRICDQLIAGLDALAEAHQLGIVHRDLKPENIILKNTRSGGDLVKVVDFGLATIVGGETSITRPGLVCGTPDYMSPEQGRGEAVDGRGDLYSLGVMLFELLCDELPFVDETPTKVVLKHLHDPIPDPRVVAPHRHIPDDLAELTMKALSKDREDRFQSAEEMQQALRDVVDSLRAARASVKCPDCGESNPIRMRFCGNCGNRLPSQFATPAPSIRPSRNSFYPVMIAHSEFIGREAEVEALVTLRDQAKGRPVWARIDGEPGVGKTRLLSEMAARFSADGNLVVAGAPHPTRAPVPYFPIRRILTELMGGAEGEIKSMCGDAQGFDALAQAGVADVLDPAAVHGVEGEPRTGAVAAAIAAAVVYAMSARGKSTGVVIIDDLHDCDGLTQYAIAELEKALEGTSVLLLTTGRERFGSPTVISLDGFDAEQQRRFLLGHDAPLDAFIQAEDDGPERLRVPLFLEQIKALGASKDEALWPPRLADAVAQRLERIGVGARRMLQAAAVLGRTANMKALHEITEADDHAGIAELFERGFLAQNGDYVEFSHAFIRRLVEAFIPAEARRELHLAALRVRREAGEPIEVLAEHAYRGGEPMSSLMVLERMGDEALRRGDGVAGVLAFRRALGVARREMLETGDTMMDSALVTFSRKLGRALESEGDLSGADGVLREALDLTAPTSKARARMLLELGRVSARRERHRDAMRHLGLALELVAGDDAEIESELQMSIGRIRRSSGHADHATNAYRRAVELFDESGASAVLRARARVELGEALAECNLLEDAQSTLQLAANIAAEGNVHAVAARAYGGLGRLHESAGATQEAANAYRKASKLAAEAGDAAAVYRWTKAAAL